MPSQPQQLCRLLSTKKQTAIKSNEKMTWSDNNHLKIAYEQYTTEVLSNLLVKKSTTCSSRYDFKFMPNIPATRELSHDTGSRMIVIRTQASTDQ